MRDAFSNNEDAPTKPNLGEVLFEILWLYFYEVVIAPVNEVCSADIVAMMSQTPHWFGLVLGPRQAIQFICYAGAISTSTRMPQATWKDTAGHKPALPAHSWAFTELTQPMVDRLTTRICDPRTLTTLRNPVLPRLIAGELRGSTQDEEGKAGGKHR